MYCAEFLPVTAKAGQWVSLSYTADFVLICNDVHSQTGNLLLITGIFEIGIEYSVRRYHYLGRRCKFTGTCSQGIDSFHCIVGKNRTETILHRQIPAVECRMLSIESCEFGHHLNLTAFYLRITKIVILILRPSRTHEHLHSVLCCRIHYRIYRTLPPVRIMPIHKFRRIVRLLFVGH